MSATIVKERELADQPLKVRKSVHKRLKRFGADKECGTFDGAIDELLKRQNY